MAEQSMRFVLEALEPRCLLNGSVLVDAGVSDENFATAPWLEFPTSIHHNAASSHNQYAGPDDNYRLRVNSKLVYEVRFEPNPTGYYTGQFCGQSYSIWDKPQTERWRFADGNCSLHVYSNDPVDYTIEARTIADDPAPRLGSAAS